MSGKKRILTLWEVRTYDVWGNHEDGYHVNDSYVQHREYPIICAVKTYNAGTEFEFQSAFPTHRQIRNVLGIKAGVKIDVDGDDLHIYVEASEDGYPLGELYCVSHESLSPIKPKVKS